MTRRSPKPTRCCFSTPTKTTTAEEASRRSSRPCIPSASKRVLLPQESTLTISPFTMRYRKLVGLNPGIELDRYRGWRFTTVGTRYRWCVCRRLILRLLWTLTPSSVSSGSVLVISDRTERAAGRAAWAAGCQRGGQGVRVDGFSGGRWATVQVGPRGIARSGGTGGRTSERRLSRLARRETRDSGDPKGPRADCYRIAPSPCASLQTGDCHGRRA